MCLIHARPKLYSDEEDLPPHRPHGSNGRPHSSNGRPHGSNGRPHGSNGRPHGSNGRPHSSNGRPHGSNGRIASHPLVIERVKIPPPPPSASGSFLREPYIVQAEPPLGTAAIHHDDNYYGPSPRASIISTQSRERDYYVDGSTAVAGRSPRSSYRYVDGRSSAQRIEGMEVEDRARGDRYGYNNFHGRRSGSVTYVNPRHSHRSVRSQGGGGGRISREKVVLVETEGRYY